MSVSRRTLLKVIPPALLGVGAAGAHAQSWPSRPITIVVPFPPGGIADPIARQVGQRLSEALGQPVVIDNKPGAGAQIAASAVKQAAADGHTLFMGHMGSQALNPFLFSKLTYAPSDFVPISILVQTPHWLVVHKDSPIKSLQDLIAQSKAKSGGLSFASQGIGTGGQLLGEMLKGAAGIQGSHVPYRGSAPALQDLLANRIDFFFDSVSTSLPFVREGKLRAIAAATPRRLAQAPDLPTMAELGFPGMELVFWFGLFAPAGTPAAVINRLHTEIAAIVNSPALRDATAPIGLEAVSTTPAELTARIQVDAQRWGKVIRDARISAE